MINQTIKKTSLVLSIVDTDQFDYSQFYTSDGKKYKVIEEGFGPLFLCCIFSKKGTIVAKKPLQTPGIPDDLRGIS